MSNDCPSLHIEHIDHMLECVGDRGGMCDETGTPPRRTPCGAASEVCVRCLDAGLIPAESSSGSWEGDDPSVS